ncbi:MAG TPA: hypothetical protein VKA15_23745 [Isosphaeraceae bacterium]|nr:hypothetical protein [Isosphaeraceae bacterium]
MNSAVGLLRLADSVLRGEMSWRGSRFELRRPALGSLALGILVFGMFYGGVMGMYGGVAGPRFLQVVYSAIKVPFLLIVTFLLSLPSFFVLNTLLGLRSDFSRVLQSLLATQTGLTVILAALAPFTAFWYISGSGYQLAILFNGGMFAVASFGAQWMLRRDYIPLVRDNPKHRWMLRTWLLIYVFVGIQMGWVLRPFIGDPNSPVQFFREGSWSNAYEFILRMMWDVMMAWRR